MSKNKNVEMVIILSGTLLSTISFILILISPEFEIYFNAQINVIKANWISVILIIIGFSTIICGVNKIEES